MTFQPGTAGNKHFYFERFDTQKLFFCTQTPQPPHARMDGFEAVASVRDLRTLTFQPGPASGDHLAGWQQKTPVWASSWIHTPKLEFFVNRPPPAAPHWNGGFWGGCLCPNPQKHDFSAWASFWGRPGWLAQNNSRGVWMDLPNIEWRVCGIVCVRTSKTDFSAWAGFRGPPGNKNLQRGCFDGSKLPNWRFLTPD